MLVLLFYDFIFLTNHVKNETNGNIYDEVIQKLIKDTNITEVKAFSLTFRYIYNALSINNPDLVNSILLIDS